MATTSRPAVKRGPSGAWSRLRTSPIDALEAYGLPSKGETRLSDAKTQEAYFETIVSRYMKFCASCGSGEKLEEAFATLSLDVASAPNTSASLPLKVPSSNSGPPAVRPSPATRQTAPNIATTRPQPQQAWPPPSELPTLLMAMRKLREGIVSIKRTDAFAQRVYIFVVRTTIHPFQHYESYHPSLLYLLQKIHPVTPLTSSEVSEFASYLILDLACRQGNYHEAYRLKRRYNVSDWKVDRVLKSLVADDWVQFWKIRRQVDGAMRVLLGWKEVEMRRHALATLGRAYLSADKAFVERCADKEWNTLVTEDKVGWVLEGNSTITIRRPRAK
ncbi:hypothetical protein BDV97DRAFT_399332 [Delphinella strobiligena]|nr:hypothetical protein BDV97DRAFT_399332 [Delphinella strobiligena]